MKNCFKTMAFTLIGLVLSINGMSAAQNETAQTSEKPVVRMLTSNVKSAKGSTEGGAAIKAFDGSGLDAYGVTHDNTSATAWRTSNGTGIAPQDYKYVAVQFNEPIDLVKMHIWNFNWLNGATNLSNRGIKDLEVWVSSSTSDNVLASKCEEGSTVWTKAISTTLTQAPANNDYTGEDVVLPQTIKDVRWVIFLCVSNYGGGAGYCGLSEVQFYMESDAPVQYKFDTVNYVAGSFTNWADGKMVLPAVVNFPKDSTIQFKQIQVISKKTLDNFLAEEPKTLWFGAQTDNAYMTRENSTWKLDGEKNVFATTDFEGDYGFSLNDNDEFVLTWPEITDCKPGYKLAVNNDHHNLVLNEAQTDYKEYMIDSVQLMAGDLIALYDTCGATTFKATVTGYTGFEQTAGDSLKVTEDAYYAFYFKPQLGADELYVVKYAAPSPVKLMPTDNVAGAWSSGASPANRAPILAFDGSGLTDNGDGTYKHSAASNNAAWTTSNTTDQSKQDCKQWIAVKFKEPISLSKMNIWNLNWSGYTVRDLKDVEVYVSTSTADDLYNTKYNDASGVWTLAATLDLPQAPAKADYTGEEYVLTQTQPNVTWVMFRALTNYNEAAATGAHYCGLSEVQFYDDTEFVAKERKPFTFVAGEVAKDNPAMFAATWSKDGVAETVKMNAQKNGEETWYITSILSTMDSVVLLRCATGATEVGENIWNQTANYELCNTMYFNGWMEDSNKFTISCEKPLPGQFYIKNNWSNSEDWTWAEMTAGQEQQKWEYTGVIGSLGINISSSKADKDPAYYSVENETLVPVQGSPEIGALDTVTFFFDAIEKDTVRYNVTGKYVAPPAPKYYVTGNAALVGEDKAWAADAIEMTDSTYTFTSLPAGEYEMKVTNGAWEPDGKSWGYTALSELSSEGIDKTGQDNIHFIVDAANDVTVSFAGGEVSVTGTFKTVQPGIVVNVTVPANTPACYFYGDMSSNSFVQMTKVDDTHYTKEFPEATSIGWGYLFVWDPNDWDTKNIEGDFTTEPVNGVIDVTVSAWTKNPPATDLDKVNAQTGQRYNILGQKVNASYRGFVIMDGHTYLAK